MAAAQALISGLYVIWVLFQCRGCDSLVTLWRGQAARALGKGPIVSASCSPGGSLSIRPMEALAIGGRLNRVPGPSHASGLDTH